MPYFVKDIMSSPVITVEQDDTVAHALTLMRRRNIHSIIVMPPRAGEPYGIITSTDVRDKIARVRSRALSADWIGQNEYSSA